MPTQMEPETVERDRSTTLVVAVDWFCLALARFRRHVKLKA